MEKLIRGLSERNEGHWTRSVLSSIGPRKLDADIMKRCFTGSTTRMGKPTSPFKQHKKGGMAVWRSVSYFIVIPAVAIMSFNVFSKINKGQSCGGEHERPPFVPYEYLRIRNKRFPWGDGNHTLFHNPKVNALPDGYEDEGDED